MFIIQVLRSGVLVVVLKPTCCCVTDLVEGSSWLGGGVGLVPASNSRPSVELVLSRLKKEQRKCNFWNKSGCLAGEKIGQQVWRDWSLQTGRQGNVPQDNTMDTTLGLSWSTYHLLTPSYIAQYYPAVSAIVTCSCNLWGLVSSLCDSDRPGGGESANFE